MISLPDPKDHLNYMYYHLFASFIGTLFFFQFSPKIPSQFEPNLTGIYIRGHSTVWVIFGQHGCVAYTVF